MTPEARKDRLIAEKVGDEVIVYDEQTHEAHRLNPTAALVWQQADGRKSVAQIASRLRAAFESADPAEAEDLVRLAFGELDRAGLVNHGAGAAGDVLARRDLLKTAVRLIPIVATLAVPHPLAAQSGTCTASAPYVGAYTGVGTISGSPAGNCAYFTLTTLQASLNIACTAGVTTLVVSPFSPVAGQRTTSYTITFGSGGTFTGTGTGTFTGGCTTSGTVSGTVTLLTGGAASISFTEALTIATCCTAVGTYAWSGGH